MGNDKRDQAESSKQGKKKLKRLRLAAIAASHHNGNEGIRISNGEANLSSHRSIPIPHMVPPLLDSTSHPHSTPHQPTNNPQHSSAPTHSSNPSDQEQLPKKRKRGKTIMKSLSLTPNERAEVEFNERGQPIGVNSKYLSSYLGALAREMVPVNINDWRKVSKDLKEDMWTCIQTRFKLDELYKKLFTQMLGHRWREGKSRLISAIRAASNCPDAASKLKMLKPENIKTDLEWNAFIKEKLSEEFEVTSKKFKAIRAENKIPHTMSRKGYARLEDDMRKESECPEDIIRDDVWCVGHTKKNGEPPNVVVADCMAKIKENRSSQTRSSLTQDGVAKTLGPERNGRVRGMGFGVTPSQLGVHMSNSKKVCELQNEVSGLRTQVQELTNMFMASMAGRGNINEDPLTPRANTPQSQNGSNNFGVSTNVRFGDLPKKCKLLNWQKKVVAEGTLASTDPNALVHHVPLGADIWKVWIDVALDPLAPLWRATSEMSIIEQAVGTTVAWHKDFISLD